MQYSLLTLATLLAAVSAQGGVPSCATQCINLLPPNCSPQDIACICGDKDFISNVSCCVSQKCSKDDQTAALQFAQQICGGGGVTLTVTAASCAATAASSSPTTAVAVTSTPASVSAAASSVSSVSSQLAASGSSAASVASTSAAAQASSASSAASSVSRSISSGAAPHATAVAGLVGAAMAAVAML